VVRDTGAAGPRFELSTPSVPLVREVPLAGSGTVMQSFGFDHEHERIIVAQISKRIEGNLRLSRLTLDGKLDGEMELDGFGHGGQIGVEPDGKHTCVWVETDPKVKGTAAWGRQVARVRFSDGDTVAGDDDSVDSYDLVPGATMVTCAVDPGYGRLAVRYTNKKGKVRFRIYDLDSVKAGNDKPRYDLPAPPLHVTEDNPKPYSQGFAVYGSHLYTLEGNPYGVADSVEPIGNAYLTTTDLSVRGGRVVETRLVTDDITLPFREPEGMSVLLPGSGGGATARLAFGFASVRADGTRVASIYCKSL
jgi:hypothetical protein